MILYQNFFNCLFFRFCKTCIGPLKSFLGICFEILWSLEDQVFLCPLVHSIRWGFLSVLGCDHRALQDFQVLGTQMCCLGARVYSFWEVHLGGSQVRFALWNHTEDCHIYWFDVLRLLRSNHGEVCNLRVFFDEIWWSRCIGNSDCYSLVSYCGHWVGNQQTCCFRKLLQRCHSACCVPF